MHFVASVTHAKRFRVEEKTFVVSVGLCRPPKSVQFNTVSLCLERPFVLVKAYVIEVLLHVKVHFLRHLCY